MLKVEGMSLLHELDAFYLEHRRCGELEANVTDGEPGWVVIVCSCGAQIARRISAESP